MNRPVWLWLGLVVFGGVIGCRTAELAEPVERLPRTHHYVVTKPVDTFETPQWLLDAKREMEASHHRLLAVTTTDLEGGGPESPLWNLMSDLFRYRATLVAERFVHVALLDPDRFQFELRRGEITSGDLYHLYPEPDRVTILGLTRQQIDELARDLAANGPAPVSGLRLVIDSGSAQSVVLDYADLTNGGLYHVAVPTHLLTENRYPVLAHARTVDHYPVRVRDLIAAHLRSYGSVESYRDLRVRVRPEQLACPEGEEALAAQCL